MMNFSQTIYYLIVALSLINFARLSIMLIGSDLYDIREVRRRARDSKRREYKPLISVIIPAYNEEVGVIRTLESVLANPYSKKQVLVVNDGSTDKTLSVLKYYQRQHPGQFTIINQQNAGKAAAINRGVRRWAKGSLVMVLDADSLIRPDSISKMVSHFRDRRVIASAANVKVINSWRLLGIAQRFEYLISYRIKRAYTALNMEYIIGGVGSTFRRSVLLKVGLFDTDTITEDIDLTVKLIHILGNRRHQISYASDVVAYTEHVQNFKSLIRQRFRWKYGRLQVFLKHRELFFGHSQKHNKRLTWYQFPYAVFGELMMLAEPVLVGFIFFVIIKYGDLTSLMSVYLIITSYLFINLLGEDTESLKSKLQLSLLLPFTYFLLYALSAVEFSALMISIFNAKKLINPDGAEGKWKHVERSGKPVSL